MKQDSKVMVSTRETKRKLLGDMNKASEETSKKTLPSSNEQLHNIHGEEISQSSRTTVSSMRTPTNSRVKFEKHRRTNCTF